MDACVYGGTAAGLGESAEWNGEESLPQRIALKFVGPQPIGFFKLLFLYLRFHAVRSRVRPLCSARAEIRFCTRLQEKCRDRACWYPMSFMETGPKYWRRMWREWESPTQYCILNRMRVRSHRNEKTLLLPLPEAAASVCRSPLAVIFLHLSDSSP